MFSAHLHCAALDFMKPFGIPTPNLFFFFLQLEEGVLDLLLSSIAKAEAYYSKEVKITLNRLLILAYCESRYKYTNMV